MYVNQDDGWQKYTGKAPTMLLPKHMQTNFNSNPNPTALDSNLVLLKDLQTSPLTL